MSLVPPPSLPPLVQGPRQGTVSLTVEHVVWNQSFSGMTAVRVLWFGESSGGTLFQPNAEANDSVNSTRNTVSFPVVCKPRHLAMYLRDMGNMVFNVFRFEDDSAESLRRESNKSRLRSQWPSRQPTKPKDPVGHCVLDLVEFAAAIDASISPAVIDKYLPVLKDGEVLGSLHVKMSFVAHMDQDGVPVESHLVQQKVGVNPKALADLLSRGLKLQAAIKEELETDGSNQVDRGHSNIFRSEVRSEADPSMYVPPDVLEIVTGTAQADEVFHELFFSQAPVITRHAPPAAKQEDDESDFQVSTIPVPPVPVFPQPYSCPNVSTDTLVELMVKIRSGVLMSASSSQDVYTYVSYQVFSDTPRVQSKVVPSTTPNYNVNDIFPRVLSPGFLDSLRDRILFVEVWRCASSKNQPCDDDELLGMAKIPLLPMHQKIQANLATGLASTDTDSLVAYNCVFFLTNPFTGAEIGELDCLLAIGSKKQLKLLSSDVFDRSGNSSATPFDEPIKLPKNPALAPEHTRPSTAMQPGPEVQKLVIPQSQVTISSRALAAEPQAQLKPSVQVANAVVLTQPAVPQMRTESPAQPEPSTSAPSQVHTSTVAEQTEVTAPATAQSNFPVAGKEAGAAGVGDLAPSVSIEPSTPSPHAVPEEMDLTLVVDKTQQLIPQSVSASEQMDLTLIGEEPRSPPSATSAPCGLRVGRRRNFSADCDDDATECVTSQLMQNPLEGQGANAVPDLFLLWEQRLAKLNAASGSALSAGNAAASHDRMELVSQPEDFVKAAVAAAEAVAALAIPSSLHGRKILTKREAQQQSRGGAQVVLQVCVEQALNLPRISNYTSAIPDEPNCYVICSLQKGGASDEEAANDGPATTSRTHFCTAVAPGSVSPKWQHTQNVALTSLWSDPQQWKEIGRLSLEFQVFHRRGPLNHTAIDGRVEEDAFIGVATVPLLPFRAGFSSIAGWYHILDFKHTPQGQIKVSVAPDEGLLAQIHALEFQNHKCAVSAQKPEHDYDCNASSDVQAKTEVAQQSEFEFSEPELLLESEPDSESEIEAGSPQAVAVTDVVQEDSEEKKKQGQQHEVSAQQTPPRNKNDSTPNPSIPGIVSLKSSDISSPVQLHRSPGVLDVSLDSLRSTVVDLDDVQQRLKDLYLEPTRNPSATSPPPLSPRLADTEEQEETNESNESASSKTSLAQVATDSVANLSKTSIQEERRLSPKKQEVPVPLRKTTVPIFTPSAVSPQKQPSQPSTLIQSSSVALNAPSKVSLFVQDLGSSYQVDVTQAQVNSDPEELLNILHGNRSESDERTTASSPSFPVRRASISLPDSPPSPNPTPSPISPTLETETEPEAVISTVSTPFPAFPSSLSLPKGTPSPTAPPSDRSQEPAPNGAAGLDPFKNPSSHSNDHSPSFPVRRASVSVPDSPPTPSARFPTRRASVSVPDSPPSPPERESGLTTEVEQLTNEPAAQQENDAQSETEDGEDLVFPPVPEFAAAVLQEEEFVGADVVAESKYQAHIAAAETPPAASSISESSVTRGSPRAFGSLSNSKGWGVSVSPIRALPPLPQPSPAAPRNRWNADFALKDPSQAQHYDRLARILGGIK